MSTILGHAADPLEYLQFRGSPRGEVFYGVELEVEVSDEGRYCNSHDGVYQYPDRVDAANKVAASMGEGFVIFKRDGSLKHYGNGGFEIVTAPASLLVHRNRWGKFFDSSPEDYLEVSTRCGMHVHVSRAPLARPQLARMVEFVNEPANDRLIVGIAGRDASAYGKRWKKSPEELDALQGVHKYEAVNLLKSSTVELRIFASTLKREVLLARLEFTVALVEWAGETNKLTIEAFSAWTAERSKRFPTLVGWLKDARYVC